MHDDPTRPVKLIAFAGEAEATIIANALQSFGIKANTVGGFVSGFKAEAPGEVALMVPANQLEQARKALAEIMKDQEQDIDWSQVDVGDPET